MPSNVYTVGLRNAGSYQVAGQPYLSGSTTSNTLGSNLRGYFAFPYVSKKIKVNNESTNRDLIVSFAPFLESEKGTYNYSHSASGSGNWLFVKANTSIELDVKCKEIFIAPATAHEIPCSVYAELTNIPTDRMYSFSGLAGVTYE